MFHADDCMPSVKKSPSVIVKLTLAVATCVSPRVKKEYEPGTGTVCILNTPFESLVKLRELNPVIVIVPVIAPSYVPSFRAIEGTWIASGVVLIGIGDFFFVGIGDVFFVGIGFGLSVGKVDLVGVGGCLIGIVVKFIVVNSIIFGGLLLSWSLKMKGPVMDSEFTIGALPVI